MAGGVHTESYSLDFSPTCWRINDAQNWTGFGILVLSKSHAFHSTEYTFILIDVPVDRIRDPGAQQISGIPQYGIHFLVSEMCNKSSILSILLLLYIIFGREQGNPHVQMYLEKRS